MARHRRTDIGEIPENLCRYVPAEWAGDDPLTQWRDACWEWLHADKDRSLPFGEFGDFVDVFREIHRIRVATATAR
jgi:hypothetical protein